MIAGKSTVTVFVLEQEAVLCHCVCVRVGSITVSLCCVRVGSGTVSLCLFESREQYCVTVFV